MQYKITTSIVVFLLIVLQSVSSESSSRKSSKKDDDSDIVIVTDKKKSNYASDDEPELTSYRRDRISPYGSSSNNQRSRSRWSSPSPSHYNHRNDYNEWSPYEYGLDNYAPNFPMPLPPSAYETGPYISNGPSCYPLLDSQYPVFSDLCGAVPQARYALPNAFGHIERWQIAQALTAILGPTTPTTGNPVCTRSLRLLLCPLLFPPCPTRFEAPPVLPCQPFCRVVKAQCASPGLELLPCDLLPPTSDLCPINPTPYSSLLSSFVPPLPFNGPFPPPGLSQSPLSSLLAQSAFASGMSPANFPPTPAASSPFPSMMSPFMNPTDMPPGALSTMFAQSGLPPQALSSMLSQSALSSGASPSSLAALLSSSGMPQSGMFAPMNPFFNQDAFMSDSLAPLLVDFPPLPYGQNFPQTSRYYPLTRSATEKV